MKSIKKFLAVACSVVMCCAMLASCGDSSSSSSSADSSAVSSETSSQSADESVTDETSEDLSGTYAYAYTQKLNGKNFSIDMTVSSEAYDTESSMLMEYCGNNYHMVISSEGMEVELYVVDEQMYIMDATTMTYTVMEYSTELYGEENPADSAFGLQDGCTLISSEETEDGLICETYELSLDDLYSFSDDSDSSDSESDDEDKEIYSYYFDKETGDLVKLVSTSYGIEQTATVNSFSTDVTEITLPDLSDWNADDEESVSEEYEDGYLDSAVADDTTSDQY